MKHDKIHKCISISEETVQKVLKISIKERRTFSAQIETIIEAWMGKNGG